MAHLGQTEEAAAVMQLAPLLAKIQTTGIEELAQEDADAASVALQQLLQSEDICELINPEVIALVQTSPDPEFHVNDIIEGIKKLGAYDADDDIIFLRPGILSFAALGEKLGRAASFYAGYGPADDVAMDEFMNACAAPGLGKSWFEVAAMPATDSTCGQVLDGMLSRYRAAFIADEASIHSRIDDPIGKVMPALISTSVLTGDAVAEFASARQAYAAATPRNLSIDLDDVKFGYWGARADLERVAENNFSYDDLKTKKFISLGEATWREALSYSPAEPGLARALELPSLGASQRRRLGRWLVRSSSDPGPRQPRLRKDRLRHSHR